MLKIGITGSFGSGKSTVAALFHQRGAEVIDVDGIVHELLAKDRGVLKSISRIFGSGVVGADGVDRKILGRIVFSDPQALRSLEAVVHPAVKKEIIRRLKACRRDVVVIDAALLIEAGWDGIVDTIVVVRTKMSEQISRVSLRTGLCRSDIIKRLRRQMPLAEKLKYADYVVNNSGRRSDTDKQVKIILSVIYKN